MAEKLYNVFWIDANGANRHDIVRDLPLMKAWNLADKTAALGMSNTVKLGSDLALMKDGAYTTICYALNIQGTWKFSGASVNPDVRISLLMVERVVPFGEKASAPDLSPTLAERMKAIIDKSDAAAQEVWSRRKPDLETYLVEHAVDYYGQFGRLPAWCVNLPKAQADLMWAWLREQGFCMDPLAHALMICR